MFVGYVSQPEVQTTKIVAHDVTTLDDASYECAHVDYPTPYDVNAVVAKATILGPSHVNNQDHVPVLRQRHVYPMTLTGEKQVDLLSTVPYSFFPVGEVTCRMNVGIRDRCPCTYFVVVVWEDLFPGVIVPRRTCDILIVILDEVILSGRILFEGIFLPDLEVGILYVLVLLLFLAYLDVEMITLATVDPEDGLLVSGGYMLVSAVLWVLLAAVTGVEKSLYPSTPFSVVRG